MKKTLLILILAALAAAIASPPALADGVPSDDMKGSASLGQRQLIQAIDAAWVEILEDGTYYEIINDSSNAAFPQGTPASKNAVNQADCLPDSEVTTYPSRNPAGNFKIILQEGEINRCNVSGFPAPTDTSNFYRTGKPLERAIFDKIGEHYGVSIDIIDVEIPPPFDLTTALNDGTCDVVTQVNALGGESEDLRRRNTRLFSCVISSGGQFLYVPDLAADRANCDPGLNCATKQELDAVQNITDMRASGLKICTGNLSTQMSNQYFPNSDVNTVRFPGDIGACAENVYGEGYCACLPPFIPGAPPCEYRPSDNPGGVCPLIFGRPSGPNFDDVMVFSINDIDDALNGFSDHAGKSRQVDLKIVAGTPLWVGIAPPRKK